MPNTFLLGEVILAASSNMTLIFASIHLEQIVEWHTGPDQDQVGLGQVLYCLIFCYFVVIV